MLSRVAMAHCAIATSGIIRVCATEADSVVRGTLVAEHGRVRARSVLVAALAVGAGFGGRIAFADPSSESSSIEIADRLLALGRFHEALDAYRAVIASSPQDRHALREAGRAAHALQDFSVAIDLLSRADALATDPDPELHFLLGEAYWASNQPSLAAQQHARARSEIGPAPAGRLEQLWLAKIDARSGDRIAADKIYDALARVSPGDAEVAFAQTEMHAAAKEWDAAEHAIRRFLAVDPGNPRAHALLAWVDEARGRIDSEVAVRESLAHKTTDKDTLRDYGRALERAGNWAGARDAYARAAKLPGGAQDASLALAFERVDGKTSIEVAAGAVGRTDPAASSLGAITGVAVPFGPAHHLAVSAWSDRTSGDGAMAGRTAIAGELQAALSLHGRFADILFGSKFGAIDSRPNLGTFASIATAEVWSHLKLTFDGEFGSVWHETPKVELERGIVDGATVHAYGVALDHRLVIDTGVQARRLRLEGMGNDEPSARQLLGWAGADFVAWRDFAHEASGQILDENLLYPTYAADSAVVSYRHYELDNHSDAMFDSRLSIAPRASIDDVSATARKVVAGGRIAGELRAGLGWDRIRQLTMAHGGGSLWLAPTRSSRIAVSFDLAKETVGSFEGQRRIGWMTYHVDL